MPYVPGKLVNDDFNYPFNGTALQDNWIRVNTGKANVFIEDDGANPALVFDRNEYGYAVHDIGALLRGGKVITEVDTTPPSGWIGNYRLTTFYLGGDQFHEGNCNNGEGTFYKWTALGFGFRATTSVTNSAGVYTNVAFFAYNGDGADGASYVGSNARVDPSHWYRFVATTFLNAGTSDVAVYDLGTAHPTFATATPATPVATFTGMAFRRPPQVLGGISCIGMYVNTPAFRSTISATESHYWDNIRITYKPSGAMIIFR